jgi:hypothetical protein
MRRAVVAALVLTLLLTFCLTAPAQAATSWNVQTVDENAFGLGNGYCPIVLDADNVPSIAYTGYDKQDNHALVMYAGWNSSLDGFSTQRITIGYATDIMLDPQNSPVILCGSGGLQYTTWNGTGWTFQKVDDGNFGTIALDSTEKPHVGYISGNRVKYASWTGSNWTTQTIDTYSTLPSPTPQVYLDIDSTDKPYIMYFMSPDLKLATLENSAWHIETVSLPDTIKGIGNMVLDSKDHPHLIYSVGSIGDATVKCASWNGFSWKTQTVASGILDDIRFPGFIALDSLDYPHISFISSEGLMYAGWTGAEWNIQTAYTDLPAHDPTYMALDSNRIPHISFRASFPGGEGWIMYMMYAVATEPVSLSSPLLLALPLLSVLTAVIIGAIVAIVYAGRRKRKH